MMLLLHWFLLMHLFFSALASLNLPAAIEDLSGARVPQSVLDKSAEIKAKGGLEILDRMMQDLPELLTRNREIIDEVSFVIYYLLKVETFAKCELPWFMVTVPLLP